jgi:ATP-dependent Lon protease
MARMGSITRPDALADMIAQWAPGSVAQKQRVLETLEPLARLEAAVALLRLASASAA